jgi:hypothetical protein
VLQLEFQFPRAARRHYLRRLGELSERTGWQTRLTEETNEADLFELIQQWLIGDPGMDLQASHSAAKVRLRLKHGAFPSDATDFAERFLQRTGYQLDLGLEPISMEEPLDDVDAQTAVSDPAGS